MKFCMPMLVMVVVIGALASAPQSGGAPVHGAPGCPVFPRSNVWNTPVAKRPVAKNSAKMIRSIGLGDTLHTDTGGGGEYGIPINIATSSTPRRAVTFEYDDESDHVRYPIPANPRIEGGGDRHLLVVDRSSCKLYELFAAEKVGGRWHAGSGAVWSLTSNRLRPSGWTSADAAGLPIVPGLLRYDEVAAGRIDHALRFTARSTRKAFIYPARHYASSNSSTSLPPMGLRVRLKSSVDISSFPKRDRVILQALKTYGMILADNGSDWFVTGESDRRWDDDELHKLRSITGADFEVVDTAGMRNG